MSIVKAYALPHPPLAIPEIGKGDEKKIVSTIDSFSSVAEEIASLAPDTIIFITPHNVNYSDYFHISPGTSAKGDFRQFNAKNVSFDIEYDDIFINRLIDITSDYNLPIGTLGETNKKLDHGVMVPLYFINKKYSDFKIVRISQSGLDCINHYNLGTAIQRTAEETGLRTIVIASGDLSHKLENSPYGTVEEGIVFDKKIIEIFENCELIDMFSIPEDLRNKAAECGYNSFVVMVGSLNNKRVTSKLLSYEGPFGVGYAAATFTPIYTDMCMNRLERFMDKETKKNLSSIDRYCRLAKESLEYTLKNSKILPTPNDIDKELLNQKAGVFVTIYKYGNLRGCIGTIYPTKKNIAEEIITNAVSAGTNDYRFEPIQLEELSLLTYKVDVLCEPEEVFDLSQLDIKRYGVIVTRGRQKGLLLPNLEGVDSVKEQISIAKSKAGLPDTAEVKIERFEVVRHE